MTGRVHGAVLVQRPNQTDVDKEQFIQSAIPPQISRPLVIVCFLCIFEKINCVARVQPSAGDMLQKSPTYRSLVHSLGTWKEQVPLRRVIASLSETANSVWSQIVEHHRDALVRHITEADISARNPLHVLGDAQRSVRSSPGLTPPTAGSGLGRERRCKLVDQRPQVTTRGRGADGRRSVGACGSQRPRPNTRRTVRLSVGRG
jgi:hypothetical protein